MGDFWGQGRDEMRAEETSEVVNKKRQVDWPEHGEVTVGFVHSVFFFVVVRKLFAELYVVHIFMGDVLFLELFEIF